MASKKPFKELGEILAELRRQRNKTADEVAGAVEIDRERLLSYERGEAKPAEDILGLLISHFNLDESEADKVWQMANYRTDNSSPQDQGMMPQAAIMLLPLDARIIYSDSFQITANKKGVIINFMQSNGTKNPLPISKIGMSFEQAKEMYKILGKSIDSVDNQNTISHKNSDTK